MVEQACRGPQASRALIENEGLQSMGFTTGDNASSFGANIPVKLTPAMLQVPHQVLPMPAARHSARNKVGGTTAQPTSHWKFPHKADRFPQAGPRRELRYAIILSPKVEDSALAVYEKRLQDQFGKLNLFSGQYLRISEKDCKPGLSQVTETCIHAKLDDLTKESRSLDFVFFLLDRADTTVYRNFRNATDRLYPIQSVCITLKDPKPPKHKPLTDKEKENHVKMMISEINTNIMMKVNLKLEGTNHRIDEVSKWLKNTVVIGADLVHPGAGAFPGTPSIAAVVGSIDPDGRKCLGSLRLQQIDKTNREIIDAASLEEMVLNRLASWEEHHGKHALPTNIIYYRDGVSADHYEAVQNQELKAIEEAYRSASKNRGLGDQKLNLTAVVVAKPHHTRFYPQKPDQGDPYGNWNTHPGTCVDQLVTSPYYQDFFLQSHSGIKGTARPTHYFVLKNYIPGMDLTALRDLTHQLCYSYVRSMCGVSYASPTYYADRLCERGRLYIRSYFNGDDPDFKKEYADAKDKKSTAQKKSREGKFGSEWHVKTKEERDMEKKYAAELSEYLKKLTNNKVKAAFYNQDPNSDGFGGWKNPYSYKLRNTMFWM